MARYACDYWAMDIADWSAESDGSVVVFTPPDDSADLRITTCGLDQGCGLSELLAWAKKRSPVGVPIANVTCGQFAGVSYELLDRKGVYWREWLLSLAELVLLITYCSEDGSFERHRDAAEQMLSTLSDNRP